MKTGVELIAEERKRQIEQEGYTKEHDNSLSVRDLALAGATYALPEKERRYTYVSTSPLTWTFEDMYWKPCPNDRKRELVKAGALIAAAIDRMEE
jgi:hypothetical protein